MYRKRFKGSETKPRSGSWSDYRAVSWPRSVSRSRYLFHIRSKLDSKKAARLDLFKAVKLRSKQSGRV